MVWPLLPMLVIGLLAAVVVLARRRHAFVTLERAPTGDAERRGSREARLQYPFIDLTRCIGCGGCVRACPEEGVLDLAHGQAVVVHGSRCVGHGRCVDACPTGAIAITPADVAEREELPAITETFEAQGQPGLFLAGEVTGYALVRTAIAEGAAVADTVATRLNGSANGSATEHLDLLVVGAGPAGIACSLRAKEKGLRFRTIDQETLGGTVARYPRRKMVMTQPVDLPLYGRLEKASYAKEELVTIWREMTRKYDLPVRTGVAFMGLEREGDLFRVRTSRGELRARHVCLAVGRRGSPRKLGVPGENGGNVAYGLVDAQAYSGARVLVVGGGNSAVEAAIALAEQPGNIVTLSYRGEAFDRVGEKNAARLEAARDNGWVRVLLRSQLLEIDGDSVTLRLEDEREGRIDNDQVFIMAGGVPPLRLLESAGVSFDPADRDFRVAREGRASLLAALCATLVLSVVALGWVIGHRSYYLASTADRIESPNHDLLRPDGSLGLSFGLLACALMLFNVSYLLRRSRQGARLPGSLAAWMSGHVLTGVIAYVLVLLHGGLTIRDGWGGYAFLALTVGVVAGTVGRYLYSLVPREADGREVALAEARTRAAALSAEWDREGGGFSERVRDAIRRLVGDDPWHHSVRLRLFGIVTRQVRLWRELAVLRRDGRAEGVAPGELARVLALARRAHRTALTVAHFTDLRALLGVWRRLHRWLALLMIVAVAGHIVAAVLATR